MREVLHTSADAKILVAHFGVTLKTVKYALQGRTHSALAARICDYAVTQLGCRVRERKPVKYL
jgi:hypothetical protein